MHDVLMRAVKIDVLEEYDMRHHNLSLLCDERACRSFEQCVSRAGPAVKEDNNDGRDDV